MQVRATRTLTLVAGLTLGALALGGWSPMEVTSQQKNLDVAVRTDYDPQISAAYAPPGSQYRSMWEMLATASTMR
jgi:hypothetical protein